MKRYGKKALIIVLSSIFLIVFINFEKIYNFFSDTILTVDMISEVNLKKLVENKELKALEPDLNYNGSVVAYDKDADTIYIAQNMLTDRFEGALKATASNYKIYFKEEDYFRKKTEAISEGHAFELYMIGDEEYHIYHVVFTGMPIMSITTDRAQEKQEGAEKTAIYSGKVQVYDPYHSSTRLQTSECTYHKRGASSMGYEKPNYKLELSGRNLSFLGMRADDDWILNSLYDDAGLIHNKVSFEVWRSIADYNNVLNDEGVTGEYVELFKDNEYYGVYLLTERIDNRTLSLDGNDILYKCRSTRIPEEQNYSNEDTDGMSPIFLLKYPKQFEKQAWDPLKNWVSVFCKQQIKDYEEGAKLLNMENAIDYNLFILLICGGDNTRKNSYLIADYQSDGSYQFIKVPWDMNAVLGNPWVDDADCNYTVFDPASITDVNTWYTDISTLYYYNETEVSSLLKDRWKEIRDVKLISKDSLNQTAESQLEYLHGSGAYDRNYERWPHGSEYWKDEYIFEYIDGRIDFLDGYFEKLYEDTVTPAVYNGVDYSDEFEARFYWERYKLTLEELYPYDRQQLLEHYVLYGKPFELHGRRSSDFTDDWEYLYGSKASGSEEGE